MTGPDPRAFAMFGAFDPLEGTVVRQAPGEGAGYWAGAPGVTRCPKTGRFFLVYRLRRPRGVDPDRGAEIRIAAGADGIHFEDIWHGTKDQVNTTSIERCALVHWPDGGWRLYASFVDPADGRWLVALAEADKPEALDLSTARPVLWAGQIGQEGVKDPFLFSVGGLWQMIVSYATANPAVSADAKHGTHDVYNTGLIKSSTGLATSADGRTWQWQGDIFRPSAQGWDQYAARIGTVWYQAPVWLALYDGSADVRENYEERCGLAYSHDLRTFHRVTVEGPLFRLGHPPGAIRYFDVLDLPDARLFYYEMARSDGAHELRVYRAGRQ